MERGATHSFGKGSIKQGVKEMMNFKKNGLMIKTLAAIILIFIAVVTLLNGNTNKTSNTFVDNSSSINNREKISATLYGGIDTPFLNFKITPNFPETYPAIFKKDGKVGFKDIYGHTIAEAIYVDASDFQKGVGHVRINQNGAWKAIDHNGNLYDYDEVYGFEFGLSPVSKAGKYGFINTAGELVVPLIYDQLYCAYTDNARSTYAVRAGKFVYLNLTDGYEEAFERYDPHKISEYKRTIDINDYNIVVANDMLIVNGVSQPTGINFPISILQGLDFDLYTQDKKLGTYRAKLIPSAYEGEIFVSFPEYHRPLANNSYEEYYAVLNSRNIRYREVTKLADVEKFTDTAKRYVKDSKIENTPFSIDIAFEGDFNGNGVTGVVLQIDDAYRNKYETPKPFREKWTEKKFVDSKIAFVNAILIIDDLSKPLEYRIVKSNIWTHIDWDYKTENIGFIANLDADNQLELLISNGYYEYRDYAIVDFK